MKRIFPKFAYGSGPRDACWWDETAQIPVQPQLYGSVACDVAVVGGGYTGLSAALHLAKQGTRVVVLEAAQMGWGASGRNGGFCCLGGGMLDDTQLDKRFGKPGRLAWRRTERAAVTLVEALISELHLDVDRHSLGETCLAHRARDVAGLQSYAASLKENYGVAAQFLSVSDLEANGMSGPFYGGVTNPVGFALNPRKYLAGLVAACADVGVRLFEHSPVESVRAGHVRTATGHVVAPQIIVATNGYSSEDIPTWMSGKYMPAQSTVIVTRPLRHSEQEAQGWTSSQMAYDTRHLLHYFRRMPDDRFLFGMRGGLRASPRAEHAARAAAIRNFHAMFPAWRHVEISHAWSGMVCLNRNRLPFIGPVRGQKGIWTGFAYHGNGVAMGTMAGQILADLVAGRTPENYPQALRHPPRDMPFGRYRRIAMPALYACLKAMDWRG